MASDPRKLSAELRKDFIKVIQYITRPENQKTSEIKLYDNKKEPTKGVLAAVDGNFDKFGIRNLETPTGVNKAAIVRATDVEFINYSIIIQDGEKQ